MLKSVASLERHRDLALECTFLIQGQVRDSLSYSLILRGGWNGDETSSFFIQFQGCGCSTEPANQAIRTKAGGWIQIYIVTVQLHESNFGVELPAGKQVLLEEAFLAAGNQHHGSIESRSSGHGDKERIDIGAVAVSALQHVYRVFIRLELFLLLLCRCAFVFIAKVSDLLGPGIQFAQLF